MTTMKLTKADLVPFAAGLVIGLFVMTILCGLRSSHAPKPDWVREAETRSRSSR